MRRLRYNQVSFGRWVDSWDKKFLSDLLDCTSGTEEGAVCYLCRDSEKQVMVQLRYVGIMRWNPTMRDDAYLCDSCADVIADRPTVGHKLVETLLKAYDDDNDGIGTAFKMVRLDKLED